MVSSVNEVCSSDFDKEMTIVDCDVDDCDVDDCDVDDCDVVVSVGNLPEASLNCDITTEEVVVY